MQQVYVDPQYLPPEGPDHSLHDEDDALAGEEKNELAGEVIGGRTNKILKDLEITDYDNVVKILSQPKMTPQKTKS